MSTTSTSITRYLINSGYLVRHQNITSIICLVKIMELICSLGCGAVHLCMYVCISTTVQAHMYGPTYQRKCVKNISLDLCIVYFHSS